MVISNIIKIIILLFFIPTIVFGRYYDSRMGRWISPDPYISNGKYLPKSTDFEIEHDFIWKHNHDEHKNLPGHGGVFDSGNLDSYQYAGNNPVNYVDPDGNNKFLHFFLNIAGKIQIGSSTLNNWSNRAGEKFWNGVRIGWRWAAENVPKLGSRISSLFRNSNSKNIENGFAVEGQLKTIFENKKFFQNWLKGNQSLNRIENPLSHTEANQLIKNAEKLNLKVDLNSAGLEGLEKTGHWKGISHFKIGDVHIPVQKGFKP